MFEEKVDFTLWELYKETQEKGMLYIMAAFEENYLDLTLDELKKIANVIAENELAVFSIAEDSHDFKGAILDKGISFVQTNSFSNPGSAVLELFTLV